MIKQTLCSTLVLTLTGCATFQSIDSKTDYAAPSVPEQKLSLYCSECSAGDVKDYFLVGDQNDRYQLKMSFQHKYEENDFGSLIVGFTLFIVPMKAMDTFYTVNAELHDTQTGKMVKLEPMKISESFWMGWLLLPLSPFANMSGSVDLADVAPTFLKQAANVLYGTAPASWECATYDCHFDKAIKQKSTTAEDVLWFAENTHSYNDFAQVQQKLAAPLTTEQNCQASLGLIKNKAVSKETNRYWALVDFYKGNCSKPNDGIGMTKTQMINTKGIPSKGYFMDDDTELVTYSRLSSNGEYVITTTYTLDHDIVTEIK